MGVTILGTIFYNSMGDLNIVELEKSNLGIADDEGLSTPVASYPSLLSKILPFVTTNMTSSDILNLGKNILSIGTSNLEQARFPLDEYSWGEKDPLDGLWYLYFDRPATKQQIQDYIFDDVLPPGYEDTEDRN